MTKPTTKPFSAEPMNEPSVAVEKKPVKKTDYDALRPPQRTITLGGKELDISVIPSEVILRLDEIFANGRLGVSEQIELCVLVIQVRYPDLDRRWFVENTNATNLVEVIREILAPIQEYTAIPLPKSS